MKLFAKDGEPLSAADELRQIRRKLPKALQDLAAVERRVAGHAQREAELVERGVDSYLDGQDEAAHARDVATLDAEKVADVRELERLRVVVARLRERGADLAESHVIEEEAQADRKLEALNGELVKAQLQVRKVELQIAENTEGRYLYERRRIDARSEFDPRVRRNWQQEDDRIVREHVAALLRGWLPPRILPQHLLVRVEHALASARADTPAKREALRERVRAEALASGYTEWPSADNPGPVRVDPAIRGF